MNRCLCCGKTIEGDALWHSNCIKKFFGTSKLPIIDLSKEKINELAIQSTANGYTVPGVQKKLSLHLTKERSPRLTLVNYPTGYILKPETNDYPALPELEYLVMRMADVSGIKTVPFALMKTEGKNGEFAYITKRIDRDNGRIFAMEDFCQLDERLTEDKYKGSYERCAKIISKYSETAGLDLSELFLRIVFSFVIGNSDMHLKNFSLIETDERSEKYVLSKAYDMLSTNLVIPKDKEELAITLNGKKQNIRKKDFYAFASVAGISKKSADKMILDILSNEEKYFQMIDDSYLPKKMKEDFKKLICKRMKVFR